MTYSSTVLLLLSLMPFFSIAYAAADDIKAIDVTEIPLEQLLETDFIPASRIAKQISDAPSAVSIVTAQDIHDYGYRNLADILKSMRGLYITSSTSYNFLGGRGFGSPGDYAGRIMLVIDGYVTNENFYNQIFLGEDALLDVDLIERVEFIPGPGSTTYGNSAFLGVISIITKHGQGFDGAQIAADWGENGERRQRFTYGKQLDNGADLLVSVSQYADHGRSIKFPELDDWGEISGQDYTNQAISPVGESSGERVFFKGSYHAWRLEAATAQRDFTNNSFLSALAPELLSTLDTASDSNSFFNLTHDTDLNQTLKLSTSLYWGKYDYQWSETLSLSGDGFGQQSSGEWAGVDLKFIATWFDQHRLLFGMEYRDDYHQSYLESFYIPSIDYLDTLSNDFESSTGSLYIQDEYSVNESLTLVPGLRIDKNTDLDVSTSPRFAIIYHPLLETTIKLSYGKAFRNINPWERIIFESIPVGDKESVTTLELVWQQQFSPKSRLTATIYQNKISNVFDLYQESLHTLGLELGIEHVTNGNSRINASITHQTTEDDQGQWLINSPHWLAKLNIAHPLFHNRAMLGFELQARGRRPDIEGDEVDADHVANLTLSSNHLLPNTDIRFSIRNLFNTEQQDVLANYLPRLLPLEERNFWLQLEYNFR